MEKKLIPVENPEIGQSTKILEFHNGEEKCGVWVSFNTTDVWEKLGYKVKPFELGILQPNTIIIVFKPFTKEEVLEVAIQWMEEEKEKNKGLLSEFFSHDPPFSHINDETATQNFRIVLYGNSAFKKLVQIANFVSFKKTFFHQVVKELTNDKDLSSVF
jgi:hypothetical protein